MSRHAPGRPDKPARIRERLGETNESKIGVEIVVMKKLAQRFQRDDYFLRRFMRLASPRQRRDNRYSGRNDFGLRPGGAFNDRPAASRPLGQTLNLKPSPLSSYPSEAHQALASPNFMSLF